MPISARAFVRSQIVFVAVGLLALVAIVTVGFWLGERSHELAAEILAARDLKSHALEISTLVQRAESSQRGYLYTGNEVYLAPYDLSKAGAQRSFALLPESLGPYPELGSANERLGEVIDAKFEEMDQTISLTRDRDLAGALDLTLTNRGKALMDEVNVHVTGISLAADQRLANLVAEQTDNALWQRLVSMVGGVIAIASALAALVTIIRYADELARARDGLATANAQLESKVASRTADLARTAEEMRAAKERAELLVHEVNHRVANSLSMVSSLVGLQANGRDEATRAALAETQSRIQAVAMVHQRLYSFGESAEVELDDYLRSVLDQFRSTLGDGNRISLSYQLDPISLGTDASVNLGVIAAEWVMNAAKYAYPDQPGEVRVTLRRAADGTALLAVEDDGIGPGEGKVQGTGLGSRIVRAMATTMGGKVEYTDRQPGFSAQLQFPLVAA